MGGEDGGNGTKVEVGQRHRWSEADEGNGQSMRGSCTKAAKGPRSKVKVTRGPYADVVNRGGRGDKGSV